MRFFMFFSSLILILILILIHILTNIHIIVSPPFSLSLSLSLSLYIYNILLSTLFSLYLCLYIIVYQSKMFLYLFLTFSFFLRYFQQEPNTSMRRCEELPWHLQLCRKWGPLKDTIADLKTFEMMYSRYVIVLQFN